MTRFTVFATLSVGVMVLSAASAQNYPTRPIRMMTSEAGGGNDFIARIIAQGISGPLGEQVIVDNRAGNFVVGATVAKAPPDGYTLVVFSNAFWYGPLLESGAPYDTVKDFLPISLTTTSPSVLLVHPAVPAKSVKELIALAKAKPGELNYASGTTGTQAHLSGEMLKIMAGVDIVRVPYKGSGPATAGLIAGQTQMMIATAASSSPHLQSGRVRGLAVTSAQPSALFPDLPTMADTLPGFEAVSIAGVFAPAKTPRPVVNRLNQEIVRFVRTQDAKEKFLKISTETVGSSPEEFAAVLKADIARTAKLVKDANLRVQ